MNRSPLQRSRTRFCSLVASLLIAILLLMLAGMPTLPPAEATSAFLDAALIHGTNVEFTLEVFVDNVTDLYGAAFDLSYDPEYLEVVDLDAGTNGVQPKVAEGNLLNVGNTETTFLRTALEDATPGTLVVGISRSDDTVGVDTTVPAVAILSVNFLPKKPGTTTISFRRNGLRDSANSDISPTTWTGITVTIADPFTIVATADAHGSINPAGNVAVAPGGDQTFTITADAGYHVTNVDIDNIAQGHRTTYTFSNVLEDHTINAAFAEGAYILAATISGGPSGIATSTDAAFVIGGTSVVAYKHRLDSGSYSAETPVATQVVLNGLSEGAHTLAVIGTDLAGNWQEDANATLANWTIVLADPGDVNNDETIDLKDAILSLQAITMPVPVMTVYGLADVNGDARIGVREAIYALQITAGLRTPQARRPGII